LKGGKRFWALKVGNWAEKTQGARRKFDFKDQIGWIRSDKAGFSRVIREILPSSLTVPSHGMSKNCGHPKSKGYSIPHCPPDWFWRTGLPIAKAKLLGRIALGWRVVKWGLGARSGAEKGKAKSIAKEGQKVRIRQSVKCRRNIHATNGRVRRPGAFPFLYFFGPTPPGMAVGAWMFPLRAGPATINAQRAYRQLPWPSFRVRPPPYNIP